MLFDNTKRAFSLKSNYDLKKALIIFKLISNKRLVNLGSRIVNLLKNLNLSVNFLFKETIFKQFCAGINKKETLNIVKKLSEANIYSYVHYASENIKTEEINRLQSLIKKDTRSYSHWWFVSGIIAGCLLSIGVYYAAVQASK